MARNREMTEEHVSANPEEAIKKAYAETGGTATFPTSENTLDSSAVDKVRSEVDAAGIAQHIGKQKARYSFVLRRLDGIPETLHEAKFVATGAKGVAQYLRRVAGNLAVLDEGE